MAEGRARYPVPPERRAIVQDLAAEVPPLARVLARGEFEYPLSKAGYYPLHDATNSRFFFYTGDPAVFNRELRNLSRARLLRFQPDYLLIDADSLSHFQAILPRRGLSVLKRWPYGNGTLVLVRVDGASSGDQGSLSGSSGSNSLSE